MKVTIWGPRGSIASPGDATIRYGGNTACVSVETKERNLLVLDAGTGIRALGQAIPETINCVHLLLTHLHMDHIQGLPFFAPLRRRGVEVHIYGPTSSVLSLNKRLSRYLSPPLFPVSIRELSADLYFHEVPSEMIEIDGFKVTAQRVIHPNPTVGYRVQADGVTMTYIPDHEPALSSRIFLRDGDWISGYDLAKGADLLIHDAQYTGEQYQTRIGIGHSSIEQAIQFAEHAGIKHLVTFHHDPSHDDAMLDQIMKQILSQMQPDIKVTPGMEGAEFVVEGY